VMRRAVVGARGERRRSGWIGAWVGGLVVALGGLLALPQAALAQSAADIRAAHEALGAWDPEGAQPIVERLEAAAPDDARVLFLRGHLTFMQGDYQNAIDQLERSVERGGGPMAEHYLALARNTWEQTANYVHHLTADGNFVISHPPGVDAVLVPYAEEAMASAWTRLTQIFDYVPERPVRIEIYPTVDVLGAVSPLTVAEIRTSGTIALCKYNRLMITSPRDLVYGYDWLDTLSHEFIHLLVTKKSRNTVPIWLHEGLAKYYEVKWREGAEPKLERHAEALLARALESDGLISFEDMSPSMAKLPSQEATATAFAEVFTVIEFLNRRHGGDVAATLVDLMAQGKTDREAVSEVAKLPWDRFERTWVGYLRGRGYRDLDASAQVQRLLFRGKDSEADELAAIRVQSARDHVWLGDRLRLRKRWLAAAKQYRKAVEHVGDRSPLVQGKLGHALLRMGRPEEAAVELSKPIEEHPRHVILQVYLGQALLQLGRYDEARKHLENAITINPFDPDVHQSLAIVYERMGEPERAAIERRAHQLVTR